MEQNPSNAKQTVALKNETWRLAVQTFVNIVIGTVISIIITISLSSLMVGSIWGKIVVEFLCLAITLPLVYGYMWGQGDRDSNFVQFGRMKPDKWKGVRAGLLSIIPNGGAIPHAAIPAQEATETMPAIEAVAATDGLSWGAFAIICLLPLIYAVFAAVGYYLGTKRFSIINKVVYKDDPEKIAAHRNKQRRKR